MVAGFFAILGHTYTCWLRFKGGKGIATSAGALVALAPLPFAISFASWIVFLAVSRYVSLASILGAVVLPFATWLTGSKREMIAFMTVVSLLAIYKHRSNIQRLLNGTEARFGSQKKEAEQNK